MKFNKGQQVKVKEGRMKAGETGTVEKRVLVHSIFSIESEYFVRFKNNSCIIYRYSALSEA